MSDLPISERRFFVERHDNGFQVRRYHKDNASAVESSKGAAIRKARRFARNASSKSKRAQVKIRDGGSFSKVEDYVDGERAD